VPALIASAEAIKVLSKVDVVRDFIEVLQSIKSVAGKELA
jgi:hypothetical protein